MIGLLSLLLLAVACIALYVMRLAGAWRWIYVLTALLALYLNVFVLVIQSFSRFPCDRGRAGQPAVGTGVRGGAGHRAGLLRADDYRRMAALPPA
jgi:hypothetical protein